MKFRISLRVDNDAYNKVNLINSLIDSLEVFFAPKNYGTDVEDILVGLTCSYIPEGFEHLYKIYSPKYIDHKTIKNKYTGELIELNKYFNYSFNFSNEKYEEFIDASEENSKKILAHEIFNSISNLDALPKKVKSFDKERFKADLEKFFKEQNLI